MREYYNNYRACDEDKIALIQNNKPMQRKQGG